MHHSLIFIQTPAAAAAASASATAAEAAQAVATASATTDTGKQQQQQQQHQQVHVLATAEMAKEATDRSNNKRGQNDAASQPAQRPKAEHQQPPQQQQAAAASVSAAATEETAAVTAAVQLAPAAAAAAAAAAASSARSRQLWLGNHAKLNIVASVLLLQPDRQEMLALASQDPERIADSRQFKRDPSRDLGHDNSIIQKTCEELNAHAAFAQYLPANQRIGADLLRQKIKDFTDIAIICLESDIDCSI